MPLTGGPGTDIELMVPWTDIALEPTSIKSTVHVTYGSKVYHADYGGDPTVLGDIGEATITDGGGSWRQSSGYFYLWQHWLLFHTDRVRSITWGTTAVGRFIDASGPDPAREQLFILCGKAVMLANDGGTDPVVVSEGQYVVVSGTTSSGIDIDGPFAIPDSSALGLTDDEENILAFLELVTADHPDPCSP